MFRRSGILFSRGDYHKRIKEAQEECREEIERAKSLLQYRVTVITQSHFPIGTKLRPAYVNLKTDDLNAVFEVVGYVTSANGDEYVQYKKLDTLGRPNGKVRTTAAGWLDGERWFVSTSDR